MDDLAKVREKFSEFEKTSARYDRDSIKFQMQEIVEQVKVSGETLAALDSTGNSTDQQMKDRLDAAGRRANLMAARGNLVEFENTTARHYKDSIEFQMKQIVEQVKASGETLAALDPTGSSTEQQIKDRIDAAGRRANLVAARGNLVEFEKTTTPYDKGSIEFRIKQIIEQVQASGQTLAALDPSGNSTDQQMKDRLDAAARRANLVAARGDFAAFEKTTTPYDKGSIEFRMKQIIEQMKASGQTLAALDPTGESTDQQVEDRLNAAGRRALRLAPVNHSSTQLLHQPLGLSRNDSPSSRPLIHR